MSLVSCETDNKNKRVKIVTFGEPAEGNPLSRDIFVQLTKIFEDIAQELSAEPKSGAVVLSPTPATKKNEDKEISLRQSVGAKLDTLIAGDKPLSQAETREYLRVGLDAISHINEIRLNEQYPIAVYGIAAGSVAGGCLELLFGISDFILVGESTSLQFPEMGLNFIPGWGGSHYLKRYLNDQRVKYLTTGNKIDAKTAYDWGLVISTHPDNDVQEEALKLARRLASRDGPAVFYNLKVPTSYVIGEGERAYLEDTATKLSGRDVFVNQVIRSMKVLEHRLRGNQSH